MSVILNFVSPISDEIAQLGDHIKIRLTSRLINCIARVLQELLKYFNGTIISKSFVLTSTGVFLVIIILDLNDSDSVMLSWGSSL